MYEVWYVRNAHVSIIKTLLSWKIFVFWTYREVIYKIIFTCIVGVYIHGYVDFSTNEQLKIWSKTTLIKRSKYALNN